MTRHILEGSLVEKLADLVRLIQRGSDDPDAGYTFEPGMLASIARDREVQRWLQVISMQETAKKEKKA